MANIIQISARKQPKRRNKTYRERQSDKMRKMLGLDKYDNLNTTQSEYF